MQTVICNEIPVHYCTFGDQAQSKNGTTMIFLHNAGTDYSIWSSLVEILSEHYFVISLNWPGYGEKRENPTGHSMIDYANILSNFIESQELNSIILIGNCLGSGTALEYCIKKKGLGIKHMILFNALLPDTLSAEIKLAYQWSNFKLGNTFNKMRQKLFLPKLLTRFVVNHQIKDTSRVATQKLDHLKKLNEGKGNIQNLGLLIEALNQSTHLNDLTMPDYFPPTLVIWGSHNKVLPLKKGKKFIARFQPTEHHVINGGHLVMLERPKECAEKIIRFIKK